MMNPEPRFESEMLKLVRKWRKNAYEESRRMTREELARMDAELAAEFGLRFEESEDVERRRSA